MVSTLPVPTNGNVRKGITFNDIVSIMRQRRSQDSLLITQMIDARDRYNGDVVIPLPDVQGSPELEPPNPRFIAQAIDGTAMRAAGPHPTIICPSMGTGPRAQKNADMRRKVLYAKWYENQVDIKLYRSYRHLVGYGTCAWIVMPDELTQSARLELRDPLTTYPELRAADDIREPANVGFIFGRSIDWICAHYEKAKGFFYNSAGKNWDTLWDMVEWVDEDEIVVGIMGPRMPAYSPQDARPYGYNGFELGRWTNKAGCVPAVVPRRVTLDRVQGQLATLYGTIDLHTRLTALEVVMAERHVFPDMVMLSEPNATGKVVGGGWADGRTGEVNIVTETRGVEYMQVPASPIIPQMLEMLDQNIREGSGASGLYGGQNPSGLRTGRAIDSMGSFAIDPRVEEAQRIQEKALSIANSHLIEVEKGYFPSARRWAFTGLQGDDSQVEYAPGDLDSEMNVVSYPIPGTDVTQMTVAVAQLDGAELISKHTARVKHPFIDDAEQEERAIFLEQLDKAQLDGISQQVAAGQLPSIDLAQIKRYYKGGMDLEDAITKAHQDAQTRQATQAQMPGQGPPGGSPQLGAPPGAQPGLAMPGAGVEQMTAPVPQGPPSLANLHGLLRNLSQAPPQPALNGPPS